MIDKWSLMTHIAIICVIKRTLWWIFPSQIRQMPINIRFSEKKIPEHLEEEGVTPRIRGRSSERGSQAIRRAGGSVLVFGFGLWCSIINMFPTCIQSNMVLSLVCVSGLMKGGYITRNYCGVSMLKRYVKTLTNL